jgi:Tfp pilus assembly protein PilV
VRRRAGFNLLEVIIGVFIFATATVGLTGVWLMHARLITKSRNVVIATHLAEQLMETCLTQGWQVQPIPLSDENKIHMKMVLNSVHSESEYRYEVRVKEEKPTASKIGIKHVKVRVYWNDDTGKDRRVSLETLVYWQN